MNVNVYRIILVMGLIVKMLTNVKQKLTSVVVVESVPILMAITGVTAKMVLKNLLMIHSKALSIDMVPVSTSMSALKIQMDFI